MRSRRSRSRTGSSSESGPTATARRIEELLGAVLGPDRMDGRRVGGARQARLQRVPRDVGHVRERARRHRERVGADAAEVERGLKTETPDRAARLPQAGGRVRRRDARARRRLPDADRRARARADAPARARFARATTSTSSGRGGRSRRSSARDGGLDGHASASGASPTSRAPTPCAGRARSSSAAISPAQGPPSGRMTRRSLFPDDLSGVLTLALRRSRRPKAPRRS